MKHGFLTDEKARREALVLSAGQLKRQDVKH